MEKTPAITFRLGVTCRMCLLKISVECQAKSATEESLRKITPSVIEHIVGSVGFYRDAKETDLLCTPCAAVLGLIPESGIVEIEPAEEEEPEPNKGAN